MPRNPNQGGKGPSIRKQKSNKGPITGNRSGYDKGDSVRPWSFGKGSSKSMNFGKDVKKS